ncbi:MAG: hypothetical protein AAB316_21750 [Bacteroidota bacterium]
MEFRLPDFEVEPKDDISKMADPGRKNFQFFLPGSAIFEMSSFCPPKVEVSPAPVPPGKKLGQPTLFSPARKLKEQTS